jgi:Cu2+-exporting ATPase
VNEALLTGESTPLRKRPGDEVIGGSINVESPLSVRVVHVGMDTVLAHILRLLERAQNEKPAITRLADRTASWFVSGVILAAIVVGLYWWQQAPETWLPIVVSVLVVTCPCALSLATPTALSAATSALMASALLPARGNRLETLARCTHVVFDKTGTLTRGEPTLSAIHSLSGLSDQEVLQRAAALESRSEHPVGRAICRAAGTAEGVMAADLENHPGAGISGRLDGNTWYLGSPDFIARHSRADTSELRHDTQQGPAGTRVVLADAQQLHALFILQDAVRTDAAETVAALKQDGRQLLLLTGDNLQSARQVADRVGIDVVQANMTPQDKLEALQDLQRQGAVVAMVGDGINDAPVLAAADVSIAMHDAAHISHASADMILMSDQLCALAGGVAIARKTQRIIRQNLSWAIAYNLIALPAAALGHVAPWMAAIGMSSSSLLVVLNALRLTRKRRGHLNLAD